MTAYTRWDEPTRTVYSYDDDWALIDERPFTDDENEAADKRLNDAAVVTALWDLVWAGRISNDTFTPVRSLLASGRTAHKQKAVPARARTSRTGRLGRAPGRGAGWGDIASRSPRGSWPDTHGRLGFRGVGVSSKPPSRYAGRRGFSSSS